MNIEQQFLPGEDVTNTTKIVSHWNYMMIRCSKFYGEVKESCKTFSSPLLLMVERKIIHKSFGHFHLINIWSIKNQARILFLYQRTHTERKVVTPKHES